MTLPNRTDGAKATIITSGADLYVVPDNEECRAALAAWNTTYGANTTVAITLTESAGIGGYGQTGPFYAMKFATS